jgi:hypothetical protein
VPDFYDFDAAAAEWTACARLIAGLPAMRLMVTRKKRPGYPATAQRPLDDALPSAPAAVMLWDTTRRLPVLALDFDAKNGSGPQAAARDAADAVGLLAEVGLHPVADRGPTGGWHVYAQLPQPAAVWEVRQLATALAHRWASLDPSPLLNIDHGCIRPPGAAHRTGGYQRLTQPLEAAVAALTTVPDLQAWVRLRDRVGAVQAVLEATPAELGTAAVGVARRQIAAAADQLARTGEHPTRGFDSPSEARYSVICSAVAAGWNFADVEAALRGPWTWLRDSYGTKHHSALLRDWRKARNQRTHGAGRRTVRIPNTSHQQPQGGRPAPALLTDDDPHLALRKFTTHSRHHARRHHHSPTLRAVLEALIWAGHVQGRTLVNVGVRSLAEQAALSHVTVAEALHTLAEAGLIHRLSTGRGPDADVWRLNVELAERARPARGRRVGVRPVFRTLGGHRTGEIYELLRETPKPLMTGQIADTLGYSRQRVSEALQLLGGWQLAQHTRHEGWTIGTADPTELARRLGGWDDWHQQHQRHRAHRAAWRAYLERHRPPAISAGQLPLDEFDVALALDDTAWIAEYANGTSPPNIDTPQVTA